MNTATIYHRDGRQQTLEVNAASRVTNNDSDWSFRQPPPRGWERETPKYRATRDIEPPRKARICFEPPFSMSVGSADVWQYGERPIKAGELVETKAWPHDSFHPLNYAAEKVLEFFLNGQRSRMNVSPWQGDRLHLDDGLSGTIPTSLAPVRPPRVADMTRT